MSLIDFISREVVLTVGGRHYVCRPPTVSTVTLFLRFFGLQAAALRSASASGLTVSRKEIIEHFVAEESRAACLAVLATCVSCGEVELSEAVRGDLQLLRALADAVVSLTDPERIAEATGIDRALDPVVLPAGETAPAEDHDADAVCYVAAHFGVPPMAVMQWPYLAFLAAGEHLSRANDRIREAAEKTRRPDPPTTLRGLPTDGIIFETGG